MKIFEKVEMRKIEKKWRNQTSCSGTATERGYLAQFMANRQKQFIQEIFDRKWNFFRKNGKIRSKNSKFSLKNKFLAKMPAGTSDFFTDSGPHAKN